MKYVQQQRHTLRHRLAQGHAHAPTHRHTCVHWSDSPGQRWKLLLVEQLGVERLGFLAALMSVTFGCSDGRELETLVSLAKAW